LGCDEILVQEKERVHHSEHEKKTIIGTAFASQGQIRK